jgi:hypothetical protein
MPTRGFTAVLSVFEGTPPAKPLISKIRLIPSGAPTGSSRAHHTGGDPKPAFAKINLPPDDITGMSFCFYSQISQLSLVVGCIAVVQENEKPRLRFRRRG